MKKFWPICCTAVLLIAVLAGCGPNTNEVPSEALDVPSEAPSPSIAPEISEDELYQQFELAYDSCGSSASETDEQLVSELAWLMVKAKADEKAWPENYKAQYKVWRADTVAERAAKLQTDYDEIIAGRPLYDGVNEGLIYADYIDFENDEVPELLLISVSPNDGMYEYALEVYGNQRWHAEHYGTISQYAFASSPATVHLARYGDQLCIHSEIYDGQCSSNTYCLIENGTFVMADKLSTNHISAFEGEILTSFDNEITDDQYNAIYSKYTDEMVLTTENAFINPIYNDNWGVLPGLPSDIAGKLSFLDILDSGNIKYAKLIDMNQDGTDELLLLRKLSEENFCWTAYFWDGNAVNDVDLNQLSMFDMERIGIEEDTTDNIQVTYAGIYREKSTGEIFVDYAVLGVANYEFLYEIFISMTDTAIIDAPLQGPSDPSGMGPEELEELQQKKQLDYERYKAELSRFENIEYFSPLYKNYSDTIDQVRQQLMER